MSTHHGRAARVAQFVTVEENATLPIACDRCLGPSDLLRMTKEVAAKRCGVCDTPFTLFKWQIATDARPRATVICRGCATAKDKCQSCLGAVRRRDRAEPGEPTQAAPGVTAQGSSERTLDLGMHRAKPCTFFARGACTRGAACPFRHDADVGATPASQTSIQRRFELVEQPTAGAADKPSEHWHRPAESTAAAGAAAKAAPAPAAQAASKAKQGVKFDWMSAVQ
jgi:hypothetical protein